MLEPVAFEKSLESYLDSQSTQEIRALVLRSIKRLDGAHRVQLALFLGLDVAGDPISEVGDGAIDEAELAKFIESCALLRERFGAFLRDNPRAIRSLGKSASERILGPSEKTSLAIFGRVPPKAVAAIVLALFVTLVPLAAQYEHQRGMIAGPSDATIAPPIAAAQPVRARVAHAKAVRPVRGAKSNVAFVPQPQHSRIAAMRPVAVHRSHAKHVRPTRLAPHLAVHRGARDRGTYVASDWKFDRRYNPYFNRAAWHTHFTGARPMRAREHAGTASAVAMGLPSGFAGRAQLIVSSYLNAVIHGNTPSALHHLGLPETAPSSNVSESPIITPDARARVVAVEPQPDGRAKVEVDISGRAGEYFEVFYVAHDGPAVRIMDRYYVPVNRTAEERAARLLAKDGH